jgi:ABC-2 type transport system permease protein
VGASLGLLRGVEQTVGASAGETPSQEIIDQLQAVRAGTNALENLDADDDYSAEVEQAAQLEADLTALETTLSEFTGIDPHIIVSPFRSEVVSVANMAPEVTAYYAPGVLALLLQHIAVTFGALSLVRERTSGAVELFRVSPISPGEVLVGKYSSYMLFGGLLALVLTALMRFGLGVPMLGNWLYFALTVGLLLLASLGFGFVISLSATTDSQAVQLAMLLLLTSVFFSGFFVALHLLWPAVQVVSWLLPVTYGIQMLQAVMLRGAAPSPVLIAGLLAMATITFVWAWLLTGRLMRHR